MVSRNNVDRKKIKDDCQLDSKVVISIIYMTAQWLPTDEKFCYMYTSYTNPISFYIVP